MVVASDSWLSGVKGGRPGIIMPGNPRPGDAYRQEYYPPGQALDEATVLKTDGAVKVPNGSYKHVLVTSECSPLEPQTEQKYYVPGLGEVCRAGGQGTPRGIPAGRGDALRPAAERVAGTMPGFPTLPGRWQPCSA